MAADIVNVGWMSVLPALVAIGAAFVTRQVFISLFLGIWLGAFLMEGADVAAIGSGLLRVVDTYLLRALTPEDGSTDHMSIILFTLTVGGMIGVVSANGGMRGVVRWLRQHAKTRRHGQLSAFGMGFVVFFDDYANTLIVGKTLRPLTDHLRVSREKLAFIVDATAAPLACIALVTTWVGFQLSLIEDTVAEMPGFDHQAYSLFLGSLPYSFYPVFMLLFIAMVIYSGRDFGPMLTAERRAASQPEPALEEEGEVRSGKGRALQAVVPILVLIVTTIGGLFVTGEGETIREIIGSADPFKSMLWASLAGLLSAMAMTAVYRSLSVGAVMQAMEDGFKPMLLAVMILTFAWAIADINSDLGTANYIVMQLGDSLSPSIIPAVVFLIAAATAFATGSSWGTMAILIPLTLPLCWNAMLLHGLTGADDMVLIYASLASIMAGAVWGDHCSPISDTTILSSLASDCPHMDHVRTQLPYAVFIAVVSLLLGLIPAGLGVSWWMSWCVSLPLIGGVLYYFGRKV